MKKPEQRYDIVLEVRVDGEVCGGCDYSYLHLDMRRCMVLDDSKGIRADFCPGLDQMMEQENARD